MALQSTAAAAPGVRSLYVLGTPLHLQTQHRSTAAPLQSISRPSRHFPINSQVLLDFGQRVRPTICRLVVLTGTPMWHVSLRALAVRFLREAPPATSARARPTTCG